MRSRAEVKHEAKEILRKANANPWLVTFVWLLLTGLIGGVCGFILVPFVLNGDYETALLLYYIAVLVGVLVSMGLIAGFIFYLVGIRRGQMMSVKTLFSGYSHFGRVLGVSLLVYLRVFLWSLLFVIPGIIEAYRLRFALYNVLLDESVSVGDAIRLSKEQTKGLKLDLFVFDLSFIGWFYLSAITMGILYLWVLPYMKQSELGIYEDRCKELGMTNFIKGSTDISGVEFIIE